MLSKKKSREPAYLVIHDLINKLSVIIGHCDLLSEIIQADTEQGRRIGLIRQLAKDAAKVLTEREKKLSEEIQKGRIRGSMPYRRSERRRTVGDLPARAADSQFAARETN